LKIKTFVIFLLFLLILALGVLGGWFLAGGRWEEFWGRTQSLHSRSQLQEIIPKDDLVTARGLFTFIFPFDFWDDGSYRELRELQTQEFGKEPSDRRAFLEGLHQWSVKNRFPLIRPQKYFLIQMEIDLGIPFRGSDLVVEHQGDQILIFYPAVQVLSHRIVERDYSAQGYMDIQLPIEEYRDIVMILKPEILKKSQPPELWAMAQKSLSGFFQMIQLQENWVFQPYSPAAESEVLTD